MKACFPIDILGNLLGPVDLVKNLGVWFDSDFSLPSMFRMSAKVVLLNSVISDMSGGFLLMMFLCLWLMLLLVVVWITAIHFSGASPSSIYANYSASKIVQPELYQTSVDTPVCYTVDTPVLKNLHWLPVEQRTVFKTATLIYKYLHTGFPRYFAPYLYS